MKTIRFLSLLVLVLVSACTNATTTTNPVSATQAAPTPSTSQPTGAPTLSTEVPTAVGGTSTATQAPQVSITPVPTDTPTTEPTAAAVPPLSAGEGILVDHTSLVLFDQLPDSAIQSAAQIRLLVRHASVGANIDQGLNCLMNNFSDRRPSACGDTYDARYDRSRWVFQFRGNPGWIEKVDDFVTESENQTDQFDAFTFLMGYVDALDNSSYPEISNPENFQKLYIDRMEALEAAHPDKIFIWWTLSLARVDNANTQKVNDMIREYAKTHGKILIDIADIEAHDPDGNPVFSSRGYEIIDQNYTNETRAGHLNETGRDRLSRAFWVLMAQVAGWKF